MRSRVGSGSSARMMVAVAAATMMMASSGRVEASPANKVLRELACTSCHLDGSPGRYLYPSFDAFRRAPPPTPTACAQCHVSNHVATQVDKPVGWLPLTGDMIARIRKFHAYVEAPPLVTRVELADRGGTRRPLARFTACGLARFLSSPLPRHGSARQSMFPVEPGRLRTLLTALGPELERCEAGATTPAATGATIDRGRELFVQRACASCHTGSGPAPRLRLGFPLLGRAYFRTRVRQGTGDRASPLWLRSWDAADGNLVARPATPVIMPPHLDLSDSDLDALYAYVGSDRSDVPPPPPPVRQTGRIDVPESIRRSLYREVQQRVFDTSCRHCHSPDPRDQALIESVFGAVPHAAPVELPMTRLAVSPDPTLHELLSPGPGCSDSPLLARLKARGDEWAGHATPGAPRGMPLTMPPIDSDAIRLVAVWTQVGCPSDRGDLCEPCAPAVASSVR
jgi:mono/diheme cytochrome c family protein